MSISVIEASPPMTAFSPKDMNHIRPSGMTKKSASQNPPGKASAQKALRLFFQLSKIPPVLPLAVAMLDRKSRQRQLALAHIPPKCTHFGDQDMRRHLNLERFLV